MPPFTTSEVTRESQSQATFTFSQINCKNSEDFFTPPAYASWPNTHLSKMCGNALLVTDNYFFRLNTYCTILFTSTLFTLFTTISYITKEMLRWLRASTSAALKEQCFEHVLFNDEAEKSHLYLKF